MSACQCEYGASGAHEGGCPERTLAHRGIRRTEFDAQCSDNDCWCHMHDDVSHLTISAPEADDLVRFLQPHYISRSDYPRLHDLLNRLMKENA